MESISSIDTIGMISPQIESFGTEGVNLSARINGLGFDSILASSLEAIDQKLTTADGLVRQFAVDDSIPVHRVTIALEEARLSLELAMQVRARLVETYRELMNMQL